MSNPLFRSLRSKTAIATTAAVLGVAGLGVTAAVADDSDDEPKVEETDELETDDAELELEDADVDALSTDDDDDDAEDDGDDAEAKGVEVADHAEHPDNFGATVSEDARDGGVDGQEIAELAKENGQGEEHSDADHGPADQAADDADVADDDHGRPETAGAQADDADDEDDDAKDEDLDDTEDEDDDLDEDDEDDED